MVDFVGLELDLEDLSPLRTTSSSEGADALAWERTHSVVDVRADDEAFLLAVHAMVHGDDVTGLHESVDRQYPLDRNSERTYQDRFVG